MQESAPAENEVSRLIELCEMPQALKVLFQEVDWTGVSNQKDRRRRQNRINQRARSESGGTTQGSLC